MSSADSSSRRGEARNTSSRAPDEQPRKSPDEVLKRRLASGEISIEEYERLRRAMAGDAAAEPREPAVR